MRRVLSIISLTVAVLLIQNGQYVTSTECLSHLNCNEPNSPFCCNNYSASYSPHICLPSCAGRSCENDKECGGPGGECCNTVDNKCTTKKKCLKECDIDSKCSPGTYCCKQVYLNPDICASSCVGKTCHIDSDCGAPGECCSSGDECIKCKSSLLPSWLIAVIVIVAVLCLIGLGLVIYHFISSPRTTRDARRPILTVT